jgi:hypothetical protein
MEVRWPKSVSVSYDLKYELHPDRTTTVTAQKCCHGLLRIQKT